MKKSLKAAAVGIAGVLVLTGCASSSGDDSEETININGFAVPEAANEAIAEKFYDTPEGEGTRVVGSYGPSGDQSRKVLDQNGKGTDYVHYSLEGDVTRLVDAGLIDEDWNAGPTEGIVSSSIAVIVVEEGNPLDIQGWDDLTRDDVEVVTADPASSGAARWNVMALYNHAMQQPGATDAKADDFLLDVFSHVTSWATSGREATEAFKSGAGNVLITYENEAILAKQNGEAFDYIVPEDSFLIENPAAVLKDADPAAQDFLDFALSEEGQTEFVKKGFRPVGQDITGVEVEGANDPADPFPTPAQLGTTADLGGWPEITAEWFGSDGEKLRFDKLYDEARA
jgi:sulfate/thiosulfate transport system substrate-binding protein